jgi:hypothetical protein
LIIFLTELWRALYKQGKFSFPPAGAFGRQLGMKHNQITAGAGKFGQFKIPLIRLYFKKITTF